MKNTNTILILALLFSYQPGYSDCSDPNYCGAANVACRERCPTNNNTEMNACLERCHNQLNSCTASCQRQERDSARDQANRQRNIKLGIAGASAVTGVALAIPNCAPVPPPGAGVVNPVLCNIGIGTALSALPMAAQAFQSGGVARYEQNERTPYVATPDFNFPSPPDIPMPTPPEFNLDPNGDGIPDFQALYDNPNLTPEDRAALDEIRDAAKAMGVDIMDPEVAKGLLAKTGGPKGAPSAEDMAKAMASLSAKDRAAIEKAKKKFETKYGLSGGDAEGGGGSQLAKDTALPNPFDLSALLGDKDKRDPASLDGMQKIVGDSVIGVAGDNLFEMVKRRYQKKIQTNLFLLPFKGK